MVHYFKQFPYDDLWTPFTLPLDLNALSMLVLSRIRSQNEGLSYVLFYCDWSEDSSNARVSSHYTVSQECRETRRSV